MCNFDLNETILSGDLALENGYLYNQCLNIGRRWIELNSVNDQGRWSPDAYGCDFERLWAFVEQKSVNSNDLDEEAAYVVMDHSKDNSCWILPSVPSTKIWLAAPAVYNVVAPVAAVSETLTVYWAA